MTSQSALLLFFLSFFFSPPFERVLRYTELFIKKKKKEKSAEPNELLTGARLSISSFKERFIISRLFAFFGSWVAIYSSGSVRVPPLSTHSLNPHSHLVRYESRTVSSSMPLRLSADTARVREGRALWPGGPETVMTERQLACAQRAGWNIIWGGEKWTINVMWEDLLESFCAPFFLNQFLSPQVEPADTAALFSQGMIR